MDVALLVPGREPRQLAERHVHLHRAGPGPVPPDGPHDVVGQMLLAHEVEVRRDGMGVRDDAVRSDDRSVLQLHADGAAALDDDAPHGPVGDDLGAGGLRGRREGRAHAAHTAVDPSPRAGLPVDLADPVVHEHVRGAGAHRPGPRADHRLGREGSLHAFVLEPLVEQVGGADREEPHELGDVPARPASEPSREREPSGKVAQAQVRRDDEEHLLQQRCDPREIPIELDEGVGVAPREPRDVRRVPSKVAPERQRAAVGEGREVVGRDERDPVAEPLELQLPDDPGFHEADDVRGRGDPVAGPRFLGGGGPAQDVAPLQHEDVDPRAGEVRGAREAVVTAADHDDLSLPRLHPGALLMGHDRPVAALYCEGMNGTSGDPAAG